MTLPACAVVAVTCTDAGVDRILTPATSKADAAINSALPALTATPENVAAVLALSAAAPAWLTPLTRASTDAETEMPAMPTLLIVLSAETETEAPVSADPVSPFSADELSDAAADSDDDALF